MRQLTRSDHDECDLLTGMDQADIQNMCRICDCGFGGKMHLLMDYTGNPDDVTDPWYTGRL